MKRTCGVLVASALVVTGCGSSSGGHSGGGKSYSTITCGEFVTLAQADDAVTNGSLDIARDYLQSVSDQVSQSGGVDQVAEFGDQIVSSCDTATLGAKIITLRPRIVSVYLAQHPRDRA